MVCLETRGYPQGAPAAFGRHAPRTVTSAVGLRSDAYGDWLLLVIGGRGCVFAVAHLHGIEDEAQHDRHDQIGDERVQRRISSERATTNREMQDVCARSEVRIGLAGL